VSIDLANLPDDVDALKRIVRELAQEAVSAKTENEKLKFQLARLRPAEFGRSSEKLGAAIAQLELAIETQEEDQAERLAEKPAAIRAVIEDVVKPARRPLPEHLPREEVQYPSPVPVRPVVATCARSART
jgi:transposase